MHLRASSMLQQCKSELEAVTQVYEADKRAWHWEAESLIEESETASTKIALLEVRNAFPLPPSPSSPTLQVPEGFPGPNRVRVLRCNSINRMRLYHVHVQSSIYIQ